jgi:hypothetical protein
LLFCLLFSVALAQRGHTRVRLQTLQRSTTAIRPIHDDTDVRRLEAGVQIEREMSGGQSHSYILNLISDQYAHVSIDQKGIDVLVKLFAPDGKLILEVDSPNGSQGVEPVNWVAEATGIYHLEVSSFEKDAPLGRYEAKFVSLRAATQQDRDRHHARNAYFEGLRLHNLVTQDSLEAAIKKYKATFERALASVRGEGARAGLRRLLFSRDEAEAILSAVTPQQSGFKWLDFRANRRMAMSEELGQYRVIHFSTHGLLDSRHPELSGLVLSLVDEAGQPQEGFLRLHEIYNLRLNADLVVLSACQTGLGKQVRGEGLIGLTRGFMYAGAPRVVASLWQVDDAATAELMKRFYRGVLQEKLPPAAALRAAQIEMLKKRHWQSPYYWGAFMLQGEWK